MTTPTGVGFQHMPGDPVVLTHFVGFQSAESMLVERVSITCTSLVCQTPLHNQRLAEYRISEHAQCYILQRRSQYIRPVTAQTPRTHKTIPFLPRPLPPQNWAVYPHHQAVYPGYCLASDLRFQHRSI
jgi:hypothetical protein